MFYYAYQLQADMMGPARALAQVALASVAARRAGSGNVLGNMAAAYELVTRARLTHHRPPFRIDSVRIGGDVVPVHEEVVTASPFATLLRFAKETK